MIRTNLMSRLGQVFPNSKKASTTNTRTDVAFIGGRGYLSIYGGVENAIRQISSHLAKQSGQFRVYGVNDPSNESDFNVPDNLTLVACPLWIYRYLGQYGLITFSILHATFKLRPRVVVLFASGPCVFTPVLKLFGIRVITSLRAVDSARDKWGWFCQSILKAGEYNAWRFSDVFTVNSREMLSQYQRLRSDTVYLPNGSCASTEGNDTAVDELGLLRNGYFLFAARLDPVKRLHLLLEVHMGLDEAHRLPLVIAGGHSKSAEYRELLHDYEGQKVIFLGHINQNQLAPLMRHCRAFVLPSVLEGMSNSLLSAMATGKAVLASDIPANRDVLMNGNATFAADDPDSLRQGLEKLAADTDFAHSLGQQLRTHVENNYDWGQTTKILSTQVAQYL